MIDSMMNSDWTRWGHSRPPTGRVALRGMVGNRRRHPQSARHSKNACARRGAVAVEGAIVLIVFFMVMFALFDIGLAVVRYNMLSLAARSAARAAVVHGSEAPPQLTTWGPESYSGTAADGSEVAQVAAPYLTTMDLGSVSITMTWPDEDVQADDRVTVKMSYRNVPLTPLLSGLGTMTLSATSTMRIVH